MDKNYHHCTNGPFLSVSLLSVKELSWGRMNCPCRYILFYRTIYLKILHTQWTLYGIFDYFSKNSVPYRLKKQLDKKRPCLHEKMHMQKKKHKGKSNS